MEPFNIFEAGGREKFLKKKKEKKIKVETESKQQSQVIMIQKNVRRFLELKRFYDSFNNKIEIELENQPISEHVSQLLYYWLLTPYKIRTENLLSKVVDFWHNKAVFSQNEVYLFNQEYKILIERMIKLSIEFLKDIFIMDEKEAIRMCKMMIDIYKNEGMEVQENQAKLILDTFRMIKHKQIEALRIQFVDSILGSEKSRNIGMKILSEWKLLLDYLLLRGKELNNEVMKELVVECYPRILQQSDNNRIGEETKDVDFKSLCFVYSKILRYLETSIEALKFEERLVLMCLLRDLGYEMKQITINSILQMYKINPKIFDSEHEYREYLEEKDEYLILREEMMGEYEKTKSLIKYSLELLIDCNNSGKMLFEQQEKEKGIRDVHKLQPIMYETVFEYIYELLTMLGDVEILSLDVSIKLLVENINEVMIYNLGKDINYNAISSVAENKFLLLLTLIDKSSQETPDLHFIKLYQSQENKEILKKLIKEYLLKMLKHLMFLPRPTSATTKIISVTISILENLYNKIFRTNLLSTEIFENTSFIMKFKNYNFKQNTKDEISQFLIQFPYVFPLSMRADKFKELIRAERQNYPHYIFNADDSDEDYYGKNVKIRRNLEFEDAFEQLRKKNLRKPFRITFINQLGFEEKGIDAGGLKKEFLNRVLKDALNPKNGMFIENSNHELLPHPAKAELSEGIQTEYYEFIGKLIGLAIYSNITLGYKFSGTFLNAIVGKKNSFDDLRTIDPELYKSLIYIKDMEEDAKELELTFLYQDEARNKLIQLLPNGHLIPVTNENKRLYISLLTGYKVNRSLEHQTRFIRKGLTQMINKEWLFMFNFQELNYLISGQGQIDVDDLKYYTKVVGFDADSETIKNFWEVVREFDEDQKSKLLMFVTACPRPSFLGFKELSPPFTIACMKDQSHLLPISHTCSNALELPNYKDKEELRKKLLTAIESNAGFEFG